MVHTKYIEFPIASYFGIKLKEMENFNTANCKICSKNVLLYGSHYQNRYEPLYVRKSIQKEIKIYIDRFKKCNSKSKTFSKECNMNNFEKVYILHETS